LSILLANIAAVGVPVLIAREIFSKLSMENFRLMAHMSLRGRFA